MVVQTAVVQYLDQARTMQIATVSGDQPWCASVYFAHDNAHNLYWISLPDTRHSQEIARNQRVAGAIALPHQYGEKVHGLQFQGVAREVSEPDEIARVIEAYAERYGRFSLGQEIIQHATPVRLYQIKPTYFVRYDEHNFPEQPRQEWRLDG